MINTVIQDQIMENSHRKDNHNHDLKGKNISNKAELCRNDHKKK